MKKTKVGIVAMMLSCPVLVACGEDSSPTSETLDLSGSWAGTIEEDSAGAGTIEVTMSHDGANYLGTWGVTSADSSLPDDGGNISGAVIAQRLTGFMNSASEPACVLEFIGVPAGNTISGAYTARSCSTWMTGTFTITR